MLRWRIITTARVIHGFSHKSLPLKLEHSNYRAPLPLTFLPLRDCLRRPSRHLCSANIPGMADATQEKAAEGGEPVKTAKQLRKEAQKKEKMEKFLAKKNKAEASQKTSKNDENKAAKKKSGEGMKEFAYEKPTKPGEKKDVSGPLPSSYSSTYVEAAWYSWWEKEGFFKPEYGRSGVSEPCPEGMFMLSLPPPNVTGSLHLGHALTNSIQDAAIRWNRMRGRKVLWNPGQDHAGIATQVVVEKKLMRERGISRHDIGREKFVEEVWKWKREKGDRIYHQLRKSGCSLDWDRAVFTMDEKLSNAVKECFVRLHEEGTIYRSNRLVNWSCTLKSAISDIEVDKVELAGRTFLKVPGYDEKVEFGVLVHFAYPVIGMDREIIVATTRIETMLGDTAIAVHPEDDRYKDVVGKRCQHPFCDRQLIIVADEMVEREFGTGAVKITPAHDHNDYECGVRHSLPFVDMIDDQGNITVCDQFKGMKRFHARKAVLEALKEKGLYRETKEHQMVVPVCSRSKDIVEPLIKPQWYVDITDMAKNAIEAVRNGDLRIIPKVHEATWYKWLGSPRPWCISRQLWWGHRIPAYFVTFTDPSIPAGDPNEGEFWVSGRTETEARSKAAKKFNVPEEKIVLKQDEDVLDTWFSSALFPFSIFGWPNMTPELEVFYPNSLLETGHDILFFWVARMVFFGQKLLGKLPFPDVYLHAMIRDAHGRKMSKSLGNVIDPLDVVLGITLQNLQDRLDGGNLDPREVKRAKEGLKVDYPDGIPVCGTDAMRFAFCWYTEQAQDINLDVKRVAGFRHFCNKIWNAFKFSQIALGESFKPNAITELSGKEGVMDRWIMSRLSLTIADANKGFENYDFSSVTKALYNFWLYDLCDVYFEALKPVVYGEDEEAKAVSRNVLYTCLDSALRLISPFMPYLSEELFQRLPRRPGENIPSVCVARYPTALPYRDETLDERLKLMQEVVRCLRVMKADYLPGSARPEVYIVCKTDQAADIMKEFATATGTLSRCGQVHILTSDPVPEGCTMTTVGASCEVHLMLRGLVDVPKEVGKLEGKMAGLDAAMAKLMDAMSIDNYEDRVPVEVRDSNSEKLDSLKQEKTNLQRAVDGLKSLGQ